jgi:predicted transcriptional regulator
MSQILSQTSQIRVTRITDFDVRSVSDNYCALVEMIREHDPMYPGIDLWLKKKVTPGILSSERVAYIGYEEDRPVVSAVVKRGEYAKFCHLHISNDFRDMHLGEVFFSIMALEIRHMADTVYFTLPESLWESRRVFFESFGFLNPKVAETQYRLFDTELHCSAPYSSVWSAVLQKLPRLLQDFAGDDSVVNGLLFSIRPQFADKILRGEKAVEIRRRFSPKWKGHKAAIYSSKPTRAVIGQAMISEVVSGTPEAIWLQFRDLLGCTKSEYDAYAHSTNEVFAITLDHVLPYSAPLSLSQMEHLLNFNLTPPQSYCSMKNNMSWAQAVTVAELLHGRFQVKASSI